MKINTVLEKIRSANEAHRIDIENLLIDLNEAYELALCKERVSLIKKIAKVVNMQPEDVEHAILPKKKRQCNAERLKEMKALHENQTLSYVPIEFEGVEYYHEDKPKGIVIQSVEGTPTIVGYMNEGEIVFLNN
jgi:hypothetical protein